MSNEINSFVAAGIPGPSAPVSEADRARLIEAWSDRAFYDVAMAEAGLFVSAGVPPAADPSQEDNSHPAAAEEIAVCKEWEADR